MRLRPKLVTAPANALLSLADAKLHCRVDHSDDDAEITALVDAATSYLDGYTGVLGRCLINQLWKQPFTCFSECMKLPFADVSDVELKYFDENGDEQTISDGYEVLEDSFSSFVVLKPTFSAPDLEDGRSDAVNIEFVAGYGADESFVPDAIVTSAKMMVAHLYEPHGLESDEAMARIDRIIAPFKRVPV